MSRNIAVRERLMPNASRAFTSSGVEVIPRRFISTVICHRICMIEPPLDLLQRLDSVAVVRMRIDRQCREIHVPHLLSDEVCRILPFKQLCRIRVAKRMQAEFFRKMRERAIFPKATRHVSRGRRRFALRKPEIV